MKQFRNYILAGAVAGLFVAAAGSLQAQGRLDDITVVNVSLKLQLQSGFTDNGSVKIYARPQNQRINTKDLLTLLARDKFAQTNYAGTLFPSGSRLAINNTNGAFLVVSRNDELIADVSDILSFSSSTNYVFSGRVSDNTGLASPRINQLALGQLNFDDTFIPGGGHLSFSVQGINQIRTKDSPVGKNSGKYREIVQERIKNATGEGKFNKIPFVITGSVQGNSRAKQVLIF